jgi:transcriptional regulator with XRE-family HTH domain
MFVRVGNVWEELFGRRVKALRAAKGLTQDELAQRMTDHGHPMHQTTVAKLESAIRPTNVGEINAIAAILGVSTAVLFDYSDDAQTLLELAGFTNRLAAITEEKNRLKLRLATLDAEYASVEALRRDLQQRIEEEEEEARRDAQWERDHEAFMREIHPVDESHMNSDDR